MVADLSEDLAKRGAHRFGYDEWAVDWKEMVRRDDIDIVDIATPNHLHRPIAELALRPRQACALRKAARPQRGGSAADERVRPKSKSVHMVSFNYRKCPAVLEAKRLIDEGLLEKIFHFRALYLQDWAIPEQTPFSWRFSAEESGSGSSRRHRVACDRFCPLFGGQYLECGGLDSDICRLQADSRIAETWFR